jgi:hypothetical protein
VKRLRDVFREGTYFSIEVRLDEFLTTHNDDDGRFINHALWARLRESHHARLRTDWAYRLFHERRVAEGWRRHKIRHNWWPD